MKKASFEFGMIGLGVMGRNFALNVADNGFSVVGLDNDTDKTTALETEAGRDSVAATNSIQEFVAALKPPRRIMMLVPAGKIVDAVLADLLPLLERGDMVMDGGNSYFADTNRRMDRLNEKGINYLGVGVSGGSEGARRGPSIMPGGNRQAYESVRPILQAVAAKADDGEPCVEFMGKGAAGNYVKMVHNGIEYALMQLIAECYDVLKRVAGLNNNQLHQTFQSWNATDLKSYLIEITAEIFQQSDDLADGMLVDKILDRAQQKGTGKWTSQHAMDLGVPIPTIDSAVTMRGLSSFHLLRQRVNDFFDFEAGTVVPLSNADRATIVEQVRQALLFGYLISYAQGMHLLVEASREMKMEINLEACARIWRSGCIIRAALLEDIRAAFSQDAQLENLLLSSVFKDRLIDSQIACRAVVKAAIDHAVPVMSLGSALNYFNAIRSPRLPLNLVQAQRDFFGSHTYERTDRDGVFHSTWAASHAAVE